MTEFSIYQINTERDDNRICFLGLDTLERFQHSKEVDPVLYDRVYDGKLDCNSLETIYQKFNVDHPADYKGRSLSVSDVVEIRGSDTLNPGFYFVEHPLVFWALCVCAAKAPITKELWILEPVFRCIRGKSIHLVFGCEIVHLCKVGKAAIKCRNFF